MRFLSDLISGGIECRYFARQNISSSGDLLAVRMLPVALEICFCVVAWYRCKAGGLNW